jgi:c-di-GMP-binding flagellar brake protein YcgR
MAEALRTDKAEDDRSNAIFTTYLKQPAEIGEALKTLRNQRVGLKLTFENETTIYTARILDILGDEFLIEDLQPRSGLKLMGARRRFAFSGRANGLYLYSEANQVRRIDEDRGVPYFRIPLPSNALFQQRRRAARFDLALRTDSNPATVTLHRAVATDRDHEGALQGRMLDISAGGCRIAVPGPVHPPLENGEVLDSVNISIPALFDVSAQATLRHASYNKLTRKVICGIEFTGMHVTDRRRLEQFIQSLSQAAVRG